MSDNAGKSARILEAQDLAFEAETLLQRGDVKRSLALWKKVKELDPESVELAIHAGRVHAAAEEYAEAKVAYTRAIATARERLEGDEPDRFHWWGEVHTRPYMLARQELANLHWLQDHFQEAAAEFRALLDRNPHDNQGARFVIAPLLLLAGDVDGAMREFHSYAMNYGEDSLDPHLGFSWAAGLIRAGRASAGLLVLRRAFFENLHLAPALLGQEPRFSPPRGFSNLDEPDYARDYTRSFAPLWRETPGALDLLARAWDDPETREAIEAYVESRRKLDRLTGMDKREKHLRAERKLRDRAPSKEFYARMGVEAPAADPMHPPGQRKQPPEPKRREAPEADDKRPTFAEAKSSGAFERVLEDLRKGVGNPTAKLGAVMTMFRYEDSNELRKALDLAQQAWNQGVGRKGANLDLTEVEEDLGDPCFWMDDGLGAFLADEIEGAVDCWLAVVRSTPAIIDRLLLWDDDGVAKRTHPMEDKQAWEYMNHAWWECWRPHIDAWTALLVFWCQPGVQLLAGATALTAKPGVVAAEESEPIAGVVRQVLEDRGSNGEWWKVAAEILHAVASCLRDLDREGRKMDELPKKVARGIAEGQGIVQHMALLFAREPRTDAQAREDVLTLVQTQATIEGLVAQAREGRPPAARQTAAGVSLNAPCPCGSGKKYKRCCGR